MASAQEILQGRRGLVVDDEFLIALDLEEILAAHGAEVVSAGSVEKALAAIAAHTIDFAVIDLHLTGSQESGISVASALEERGIPFIFLSGMRQHDRPKGRFADVVLVEKPYQPEAFIAAIGGILQRK